MAVVGGCFWYGAGKQAPTTPAEPAPEFAVTGPFTHDNLSVFLLHGPDTARTWPVLGLDEALAAGVAIVHETGSVNQLAVENTSPDADLLLLSGDIVKGGRQDRVLQATAILPPNSGKVPVRSFCVEHDRWTGRRGQDAGRFAANPGQIGGKELKKAVQLSGDQGAVWSNVAVQQGSLTRTVGERVNSPDSPSSLQLALENDRVQAEVAKYREAITPRSAGRADVIGFVTVVNGQVTGAEAFGSHALFEKAWAKAVTAAAVEAVAEKTDQPFAAVTAEEVRTFLADASSDRRDADRNLRDDNPDQQLAARLRLVITERDTVAIDSLNVADSPGPTGGTADVIAKVNNLLELSLPASDEPVQRVRVERPLTNRGRAADDTVQTQVDALRARGRVMVNNETLAGPIRVQSRVLPTEAETRRPEEKKAAVVEYRERGSGAVIHRSFLPR